MTVFERAFNVVIGAEGGFTDNPADPGNWTGGKRGRGICRGTKFGIAASAHPELDIAALTIADAQALYQTQYWTPIQAEVMPPCLALLVFDAAVNNGPARAIAWLQTSLQIRVDGVVGADTIAAIPKFPLGETGLCGEFQAHRLAWMTTLPTWHVFGLGWSRRLCALPYQSLTMGDA